MGAKLPFAGLLLVLCVNLVFAWSQPEPHGSNVCTRQVERTGWYMKQVSAICWTDVQQPCHQRHRWRRGSGRWDWFDRYGEPQCTVGRSRTCFKSRWVCGRRVETIKHCCRGYEQTNDNRCQKVINCKKNNGGCLQLCKHGRTASEDHSCGCFPGFVKTGDTGCININECEKNNGNCSDKCHDTPGGYYCSCKPGFELVGPHNCSETDECKIANGGCQHNCVNTPGRYYCTCRQGYKLVNGSACLDVDECMKFNGGCTHGCMNMEGSYKCVCKPGFKLAADGYKCIKDAKWREKIGPGGTTPGNASASGKLLDKPDSAAAGAGAPIGLIVGCIIGALLLLLLILALVLLARRYGDRLQALAHRSQPPADNPYDVPANGAAVPRGFDNHAYGQMGPVLVLPVPVKGKKELSGPVVSADQLKPKGGDITVGSGTYERPVTNNKPSTTGAYEKMLYGSSISAPPAPSEDDAVYANAATVKATLK